MSDQIAFTATVSRYTADGQLELSPTDLYMINPTDASLRQLTFDASITRFDWSPDGQHLVCLSLTDTSTIMLSLLDANGSNLRHPIRGQGNIIWNWSPDGQQLALTCIGSWNYGSPGQQGELLVIHLGTNEVHQLTTEPAYVAWSLETNDIDFLWGFDQQGCYRMDVTGANRHLLFPNHPPCDEISWSPDNKYVLYGFLLLESNGTLVSEGAGRDKRRCVWSPDSQHVAYIARASEKEEAENDYEDTYNIYVMGRESSTSWQMGRTIDYAELAWSPDSEKIAFISYSSYDFTYALGVVDANRHKSRFYQMEEEDVTGDLFPLRASWSPDSQQITYRSPGQGRIYIARMDETTTHCLTNDERFEDFYILGDPIWQP